MASQTQHRQLPLRWNEPAAQTAYCLVDRRVRFLAAPLEESIDRDEEGYLDAFIAESLRLRPALPLTRRRAQRAFNLNGLLVPPGVFIVIAIMALVERTDLHPNPLAFRPERFLSSRPGTYTWLPFGGGVYRCLGAEFALFEARALSRTVLQHHRLSAVDGRVGGRPSRKHPLPVPAGGPARADPARSSRSRPGRCPGDGACWRRERRG